MEEYIARILQNQLLILDYITRLDDPNIDSLKYFIDEALNKSSEYVAELLLNKAELLLNRKED